MSIYIRRSNFNEMNNVIRKLLISEFVIIQKTKYAPHDH